MQIKLMNHMARVPTRGTEHSAGYDLYASEAAVLYPYETKLIKTDIAVAIPPGHFGMIASRSSMGKKGIVVAQGIGVIDADYRGMLGVLLHNRTDEPFVITPGERIAQFILVPFVPIDFEGVDELDATERGSGAFGSTGA